MISEKVRKILKEEIRKDTKTDKKHEFGVWYPVSDPPECDMYGLALCISGHHGECKEYDHVIHLDSCNCYEEGKFWASGTISPGIKVHAWLKIPSVPMELLEAKEVQQERNNYENDNSRSLQEI
jgi:hypothetical protein